MKKTKKRWKKTKTTEIDTKEENEQPETVRGASRTESDRDDLCYSGRQTVNTEYSASAGEKGRHYSVSVFTQYYLTSSSSHFTPNSGLILLPHITSITLYGILQVNPACESV